MADNLTKEQRSLCMSKIRSRNTKPELMLRKALWGQGFSYQPKIKGSPDFINKKRKIAVFVHGCFWHKCPKHFKEPKSNKKYWLPKLKRTVARDKENVKLLKKNGWKVVKVWEHEIKNDFEKAVRKARMKLDWREVNINGERVKARITIKESGDKRELMRLFNLWKVLNSAVKAISTRGVNLHEAISENAFCLFFPCVRVVKLAKGKCSYDCININTGKRIQIKASSIHYDLTSFGPRSEYDDLYFLDFSRLDGSFDVYKIKPDWVYNHKVNATQTFKDQQAEGKRPRFGIMKNIIEQKRLRPIKTFSLKS